MQTRLRSRLGLSGSDELPDPITKARGIESSSNSTSTSLRRQSSSLDHNSLSTPVTPLVTPPPANTSGKLRVKRTLSAAGATPPGASVVVLGAPSQAHVHHQLALDASQHRFDHVDAKTVVPRTQWRRVFSHFNSHNNNHVASASPQPQQQTVLFTPLSYHALQLDRRAQVQCSLQGTLLHALHRIRHEQRLGMLAADQETEFRDDILREARERKRRRKEGMFSTDGSSSAGTSSDRKKFVIVDSDESDGIGQEVEELISAPGGGSTRPSAKKATNNRKEVVAHGVDYYNDDDDDDDDSGALRILKVIDRLDIKLESFAKRNAEMAANYVRTADNEAPLTRGGRGSRRILLGGKGRRVGSAVSSGGVDNNNAGGVVWSPVMVEQGTVQTDIYPRLLPFQKEGIHWMVDTVLVRRLNCVLADEMGLGKTVSTIALASSLSQVKTIFVQDPTNAELIANARRNVVLPSTAKISKAAEQGSSSTKSFGVAKRARRAGRNAHTVSDSSNDDENSDDIDDTDDLSESEKALSKGRTTSKAAAGTASSTITPTSHARSSVVSAAIFDAAVPCPWAIAPTLVVAPLSTLPNWAAEFQNFEPNRFRVFTINGSREDREEQLDEFFTLLMALHGVSLRTTTSTGGRGRGGRGGARGDKKKSTSTTTSFNPSDRVMWGDVDPLQGAPHPIPVLLMPHDYFARALDIRGRRLVQHVQWELIVVDEAQRIKSNQSKLFQILHSIRSHHRLALSGTPLQNNVLEMFSLMEFILPDMFRSSDEGTKTLTTMLHEALRDASTTTTTTSSRSSGGKKKLANPNCSSSMTLQEKEEELAFENQELQMLLCRRVHKLLSPFFLRREKSSVMSQLPKKDDIVVVCPLTRLQERFLATLERKRDQRLLSGNFTSAARKVVIHPYLILNSFYVEERMIYTSGKYMVLDAVLRFLHQHNHKTLVFCSWVKVLDIVDSMLTMQKIPFVRLEGRTQVEDREKNIKKFSRMSSSSTPNTPTTATNNEMMVIASSGESSGVPSRSSPSQESESPVTSTVGNDASSWPTAASQRQDRQRIDAEEVEVVEDEPINCFLISKIAGGVGLNLQVADTVILLDTDYNPQRDAQALARVYRVGQTKHVKVLRLVTNHPVEVRMMQVASNKHQLEEVVVKAGRYDLKSSGSDRDQHVRSAFETMNHNIGDYPLLQQQQHESTPVGSPVEQMDDDASLIDDHRNHNNNNDHWNATTNLITSQLLDSIPRSEEERAAFGVFLQQHWQHLKDAEARDAGLDVSEEEAAWLRGS